MTINKAYACWDIFRFGFATRMYLNDSTRINKKDVPSVHKQRFQSGYLWQLPNYNPDIFKEMLWRT